MPEAKQYEYLCNYVFIFNFIYFVYMSVFKKILKKKKKQWEKYGQRLVHEILKFLVLGLCRIIKPIKLMRTLWSAETFKTDTHCCSYRPSLKIVLVTIYNNLSF